MAGVEFENEQQRLDYYKNQNRSLRTSGLPKHMNGSVGIETITVNFQERTMRVNVYNEHTSNNLFVSFDGGNNFIKLFPLSSISEPVEVDNIVVSGSAAGTTYRMLGVV